MVNFGQLTYRYESPICRFMPGIKVTHFSDVCPVHCLYRTKRISAVKITTGSMVCLDKTE